MERAELQPILRPPETPREPMEFLSRSWSSSAFETSKAFRRNGIFGVGSGTIHEDDPSPANSVSGNPFPFACSETSHLVMERIMSQTHSEVSPLTSGRPSHSSGPLNAGLSCGSLTDSTPVSPSQVNDLKYCRLNNYVSSKHKSSATARKTVGRWMKDRREKKKEEARTQNAQLHAAISVAGVASAIAAISAATTEAAVASAATLVAAHCVETAEAMGADRELLSSVVGSAVNVQSAGDIMTLTAAAATALRGAAALKARTMKDVWDIAAVIPVDKGMGINNGSSNGSSSASFSGEILPDESFLGISSWELLARGTELLKKTRKGDLHWKVVSVYINSLSQVMLKMKSRHIAGTVTKKKKNVVLEVMSDVPAWPGRHLVEGGKHKRYFALKTISRGVVEFECRNQREYDIWTEGVSRLLAIAAEKNNRHIM